MNKPRFSLLDIDLTPQGATLIDLGGRSTPETWTPWGTSYGTRMEDWTPEKGAAAKVLREATEARLEKATKAELHAYVLTLRPNLFLTPKECRKNALVTIAMIEIDARRYPNKFVNAKGEI